MRTLRDFDFKDKRVLVRADFNVKLENGKILDDTRIKKTLPTLNHILSQNPKQIVIMSHLGRPKGERVPELKMNPVAERLSALLMRPVKKLDDCIDVVHPVDQIILLENLRFHKEEKENSDEFAKKLIGNCNLYVNDAFGVDHRKHASVHAIAKYIPGCIGLLVENELRMLDMREAARPYVAIIGGAKLSTKLKIIEGLLQRVDKLLLSGAMIFTFYKAKDYEIGKSLLENEYVLHALKLYDNEKILLPQDVVVATDTKSKKSRVCSYIKIPKSSMGLDIGPDSIEEFKKILGSAKTIVWNGPLGYYENPEFAKATNEIAQYISNLDARTILGGGDSVDAINGLGIAEKFTHVSTGGGACLSYLAGEELPAFKALEENSKIFP